jgi:phosphoglycolate phosphatase-like HAD superfamily hydrolase
MRSPEGYIDLGGGVLARPGPASRPPAPDLLAFDVDGVLIDVHGSYPEVISRAVQRFLTRDLGWPGDRTFVTAAETALWKRVGGFNSDWQLACACALHGIWRRGQADPPPLEAFLAEVRRRGGGLPAVLALCGRPAVWDPERITRICCEIYGGDDWCPAMFGFEPEEPQGPGLCNAERPVVRRDLLLPWRGRLGVYTGRNDGETAFALERCGVADLFPPPARGTCDRGWRKPDPAGLRWLAANLGARTGLFAGDNVDDCDTVLNLRREGGPQFLFAGVLGGSPGEAAGALFAERGADLIAADVNALLAVLRPA